MTSPLPSTQELMALFIETSRAAGAGIMDIYAKDFEVVEKEDGSPVTLADQQADQLIYSTLSTALPAIPIVTEERAASGIIPQMAERFILVDPLDGTKEFVARRGEFTVNIALIEEGRPTMGVVFAPAIDRLFYGARDTGAFEQIGGKGIPIHVRQPLQDGWVVATSRSHGPKNMTDALGGLRVSDTIVAGSSLKFCLIAAGEADIYPRHGRTMEWDTAAGQAVLEAAGGRVLTLNHTPLSYGKVGLDNPHFTALGAGVLPV